MMARQETQANLLEAAAEYFVAAAQGEALDLLVGVTEEERERQGQALGAALTAIAEIPASSLAGLQAKAAVLRRVFDVSDPEPREALAVSITADILRGIA